MEVYEVYYKDVFISLLKVDTTINKYEYVPNKENVKKVKSEVWLIKEMIDGTEGFVAPIPFFQNRIMNMKRSQLNELRYHTDYFLIKKVNGGKT